MADPVIKLSAVDQTAAAFASIKANLAGLKDSADRTSKLFGSLGAAIATAVAGISLKGAVDALDRLDDLAEKTGVAVESLSVLRYAAETSGTPLDALAKGMRVLATEMASAAGGNKKASATFDALGVDIKKADGTLRSIDDVFLDVADRFSTYTDSAETSALATALFKRSGEELLPVLNLGRAGIETLRSEAEALGVAYGGDLAKSAAEFNDNLKRLEFAAEGAAAVLVKTLLPAINIVAKAFIDARRNNTGVAHEVATSWIESMMTGLNVSLDEFRANNASKRLAGMTDAVIRLKAELDADPGNTGLERRIASLRSQIAQATVAAANASAALKHDAAVVDVNQPAPPVKVTTKTGRAPVVRDTTESVDPAVAERKAAIAQYDALVAKIRERTKATEEELNTGQKLTDSDRFSASILADVDAAKSKLNQTQRDSVVTLNAEQLARAKASEAQAEAIKLTQQQALANVRELETISDGNAQWRQRIEEIGLTQSELAALNITRAEAVVAAAEEKLAVMELFGAGQDELNQQRLIIDAKRESLGLQRQAAQLETDQEVDPFIGARRALKAYTDDVARAADSTESAVNETISGLEEGLTRGLTGKAVDIRQWVDNIISEVVRLAIIKPFLAGIFGSGDSKGSGIVSLLGGLFSSPAAPAATSLLAAAKGAAFDASGAHFFAKGDIFDRPTAFKFAKGDGFENGVMGEAGPEAVMPLTRGRDGKLGVKAMQQAAVPGGDTSNTYNNTTINVASGVNRAEALSAMQALVQSSEDRINRRLAAARI